MNDPKGALGVMLSEHAVLAAVIFFSFIILVIVLTALFRRKCPQCGKYRAGQVVTSQRAQSPLGGANRVEVALRCRFCGHEWQATESRSRQRTHSSRPPTAEEARAKIEQIDQALADPNYKVNASVRNAMIASRDNLKKYL